MFVRRWIQKTFNTVHQQPNTVQHEVSEPNEYVHEMDQRMEILSDVDHENLEEQDSPIYETIDEVISGRRMVYFDNPLYGMVEPIYEEIPGEEEERFMDELGGCVPVYDVSGSSSKIRRTIPRKKISQRFLNFVQGGKKGIGEHISCVVARINKKLGREKRQQATNEDDNVEALEQKAMDGQESESDVIDKKAMDVFVATTSVDNARVRWRETIWNLPKRLFYTRSTPESGGNTAAEQQFSEQSDMVDLPHLPVPALETTLSKYLQMARVLLTDHQYERTRAAVRAFGSPGGVGHNLQRFLQERQQTEKNWAYEWWLNDMYLNNPLPLPINSNPCTVMPPHTLIGPHDQARLAARICKSLLMHKHVLDCEGIPLERATSRERGQPLCMAQFYRLLTSYRAPGDPRDTLITDPCVTKFDEHVVVACRNKFFVVPIKRGGQVVMEDELAAQIQSIMNDTNASDGAPAVGLLTSERRDVWANVRVQLIQYESNRQNILQMEHALAIICLDEPLPPSFNYGSMKDSDTSEGHFVGARDETNMAHQILHGGGSALNSGNRWYDKTLQFVISSDGVWGLCYEHSPAEGVAVVQFLEWVMEQCRDCSSSKSLPRPPQRPPQALQWQISARVHRSIQEAAKNIDSLLEDLDFYVYRFTGYGKEFIKSCNVSPDAYIQLALQLAYYRLSQQLTATYESASTRRFLLGRVDCIRSASSEARAWAEAMCQAEIADTEAEGRRVTFSLADEKRLSLFKAAVARQTQEMVDNIMGQGIDIHLLGLRQAAKELGVQEPQIFLDEAFTKMNHFALSTSQVASVFDGFTGYGPVVRDGYGASYNPRYDSIVFCLSAFHSSDATSTWQFAHSLNTSLNNMRQLLASNNTAN